MNKICILIITALCFISTVMMGCALFNKENVPMLSRVVGMATASTLDITEMSDENKQEISDFLTEISKNVPSENETFFFKWEPIINSKLNSLVESGKLEHKYSITVKNVLLLAARGIDYMFDKYPRFQETYNISLVSVTYFVEGFNSVIRPVSFSSQQYNVYLIEEYEKIYNETVEHFKK